MHKSGRKTPVIIIFKMQDIFTEQIIDFIPFEEKTNIQNIVALNLLSSWNLI